MGRRFLTAEWRNLLMLNYEVDPSVLRPLVPRGTELDSWDGRVLFSVVGFHFLGTRVMGLPIPFHRDFEEINLRFYVRREAKDGWRRGVVFVKEIVPRFFVAAVARWLYNENYVACPMSARVRFPESGNDGSVEYSWTSGARRNALGAEFQGTPRLPAAGSEEEFITEHYWGYVSQRDGSAVEYEVRHPQWRVWRAATAKLDCDVKGFYGEQYQHALSGGPSSAFVAEGSAIEVFRGMRIQL
ncbi:MAG TPA: DUF2071 domain-containing protein [Thermoanaerobaculia bacterium]|nr:DUF2071 domain-containing protein [Thermoanaerobaculia bacterium]